MPEVEIHFTPRSLSNLKEIATYLKVQAGSQVLAVKYIRQLKERINSILGTFPEAGKEIKAQNNAIRQLVISSGHKGYRIFYRSEKQNDRPVLIILAIYRENFPNDSVLSQFLEQDDK